MAETLKKNTVAVFTKDLYQFLITECRYGYSRNNHLMPGCAYTHVWAYLDTLAKADQDCAIRTAEQLCEECISDNLNLNFWEGIDDDYGNRQEAIDFVNKLLDYIHKYKETWMPYNYDNFLSNLCKDDEPRYNIHKLGEKYKNEDFYQVTEKARKNELRIRTKPLNDHLLSKKELPDYIFYTLEHLDKDSSATYYRVEAKPDRYAPKYKSERDWQKDFKTLYKFEDNLYIVVRGDK